MPKIKCSTTPYPYINYRLTAGKEYEVYGYQSNGCYDGFDQFLMKDDSNTFYLIVWSWFEAPDFDTKSLLQLPKSCVNDPRCFCKEK